jgi:hypothetical protein
MSVFTLRAVAVFGSNQTAGILGRSNYLINFVIRVPYEIPAYPLSNAPTLNKIRREMNEK